MFTGIISDLGKVQSFTPKKGGAELTLKTSYKDLVIGESVAVNGACLTVETIQDDGTVKFWLSLETMDRCAKNRIKDGGEVNLERALRLDERLSGHFVQGHVDGTGTVSLVEEYGEGHRLRVFLPEHFREHMIEKGSISIDGISLTINSIGDLSTRDGVKGFEVEMAIIPHTWDHTILKNLHVGDEVNIEADMLAKHLVSLIKLQKIN